MKHVHGNARRYFLAALFAGLTLAPAAAMADSGTEWGKRALRIQNQIDNAAPFPDTMWVGAHNSYNAWAWDSAYQVDPNQKNRPLDLMRQGVREIVFDIYWYALGSSMLLCHGTCSGGEKTFRQGLDEIRDYLDEDNRDDVIMLKIEANKSSLDDKFSKFANQLADAIGGRIYKPSDHGVTDGCASLTPANVSKQAILDKGKNVIVINTSEHGCPNNGEFNTWIFSGFKFADGTTSKKFEKPKDPSDADTMEKENGDQHMFRQYDTSTWANVGGGADATVELRSGNVLSYMQGGLNIFEMFNYNGENAATVHAWLKPQELVWSWQSGQPSNANGTEHCAVSRSDGRFDDVICTNTYRFACRATVMAVNSSGGQVKTDAWKVTAQSGPFASGDSVCKAQYGAAFSFAVPVNARQNAKLNAVKGYTGEVWVNYQDLSYEGQWIANSDVRLDYLTVSSAGGGGGSSFNDNEEMVYDLYLSNPRQMNKVIIRSGSRVDRLQLFYSGGRSVSHGGSGGSDHVLSLVPGEYVSSYERCVDKYNGSSRIFYLRFTTNLNHTVSGGKKESGSTCTSGSYAGRELFALHGRSGEELDAVGFYFRRHP